MYVCIYVCVYVCVCVCVCGKQVAQALHFHLSGIAINE